MIDDEDAPSSLGDMIEAILPRLMAALAETEIPFDCQKLMTFNPIIYGYLGAGDRIGANAEFPGGLVVNYDEDSTAMELPRTIGTIVGHDHDRVVLAFETEDGVAFLGWIDISEVNFIEVYFPEPQKWML